MLPRLPVWVGLISLASVFQLAELGAQDAKTDALKAEIQAVNDKMSAAFEKKDAEAILQYYSPEYVSKSVDGKEAKLAEIKGVMPMLFALMKSGKAKSTIDSLEVTGDTVVVKGQDTVEMVLGLADQPEQTIVSNSQVKSTMQKTKDGWRVLRSEALSRKLTVNGKVVEDRKADEKSDKAETPK